MNLNANLATLEDLGHVITIHDLLELVGVPMISNPVRKVAALHHIAGLDAAEPAGVRVVEKADAGWWGW